MIKIEIDLAYNSINDILETLLSLNKYGLKYRLIKIGGPGGNWPVWEISGKKQDIKNYLTVNDFEVGAYIND